MRVLVLNCGSATLKFQIIEVGLGETSSSNHRIARGHIEGIGSEAKCRFEIRGQSPVEKTIGLKDLDEAVAAASEWVIDASGRPDAVGHRVVHGGSRYRSAVLIDQQTLSELSRLCDIAPLHNPAAVSAIHAARRKLGLDLPMVAVFDTAFHSNIPAAAANYAIPQELAQRHEIRRYGFHGLAYQYDLERYAELAGAQPAQIKLVVLHLGNGCSAAAIRGGHSVETSMGFTPLEGLVMGTRSGDIDPALLTYISRREHVDVATVEAWLNHRSGLLGVSGLSSDIRELLTARASDERARLAIDIFCHRARKYLGAYLAVLGGADALIFSGGIGENAAPVREQICRGMRWCGIQLDRAANQLTSDEDRRISVPDSAPEVWIIHTDEEAVIARETERLLRS